MMAKSSLIASWLQNTFVFNYPSSTVLKKIKLLIIITVLQKVTSVLTLITIDDFCLFLTSHTNTQTPAICNDRLLCVIGNPFVRYFVRSIHLLHITIVHSFYYVTILTLFNHPIIDGHLGLLFFLQLQSIFP